MLEAAIKGAFTVLLLCLLSGFVRMLKSKPVNREEIPAVTPQEAPDDRPEYVKDLERRMAEQGVESERDLL